MSSLITHEVKDSVRVSSVLNNDTKSFGKKFLFDNNEDTCWNSNQGSPQFILLDFKQQVIPEKLEIMFQGGFVGQACELYGGSDNTLVKICDFYPSDDNSLQTIPVEQQDPQLKETKETTWAISKLKIVFNSSTDFYGRIVIYHLDVIGKVA